MPEYRRKRLRQLIGMCPIVKTIEVHSGLTGLIAEKTVVEHNGELDRPVLSSIIIADTPIRSKDRTV